MNRRGFLQLLAGAPIAAAVDPDRLLWTPGRVVYSIPAPRRGNVIISRQDWIDLMRIQRLYNRALSAQADILELARADLRFLSGDRWQG